MDESQATRADRRGFLTIFAALAAGAVAILTPLGIALAAIFDPLRRTAGGGTFYRVTSLDGLPADGTPLKFTIVAEQSDAWNRFADRPIGAVYLRRVPGATEGAMKSTAPQVQALQVICPHAGCVILLENASRGNKPAADPSAAASAKETAVVAHPLAGARAAAVAASPAERFICPCHGAAFDLDGKRLGAGQSPRDMDTLPVEIRGQGEVWVEYRRFRQNVPAKVAIG